MVPETPRQVAIAGRIMSRRIMGKASFIELKDSEGRIQVYISRDDLCPGEDKELYNTVFKKLLDIGRFLGIAVCIPYPNGRNNGSCARADSTRQIDTPPSHRKDERRGSLRRFRRPRAPLSPTLCRLGGKRRSKRYIHQTEQSVHLHAGIFQLSRISGSRNTHSAIDTRRCRPPVRSSPTTMRSTYLYICVSPMNYI